MSVVPPPSHAAAAPRVAAATAQSQLDALLKNATVAIFMMNSDYHCVYMNPAAEKLSGYTLAEMAGQTLHDVVHHTRPDGSHLPIEECPIGCTLAHHDHARGEEVFVHKDGTFYPVAFSAGPMHDDEGDLIGTILEVRDISQEKATLAALEESSRAKDEFLAVLGHELRNPLAPIATVLHLLRMRNEPPREIAIIERQVEHLSRLVDDLLDVSRVTRGSLDLRRKRVDSASIVGHSVEMVRPMLETRQQMLELQQPQEPVRLDADAARLSQVLTNLLVNASKFSPRGSRITLSCGLADDVLEVRVRDRGEGIPPQMLHRIFEPFVQSQQERDRSRGGLGLGLAIASTIVRLHGGTIDARSDGVGHGAEFTVRLPVAPPQAPTDVLDSREQPSGQRAPRRVLLVDDNVDGADALAAVLEAHGHQVATVYDPIGALRTASTFAADVALLDLGLPGMDGYELARRLEEVATGPTKFVALTGYGLPNDHERSSAAGFSAHLVKPVDVEQLLALLERLGTASA